MKSTSTVRDRPPIGQGGLSFTPSSLTSSVGRFGVTGPLLDDDDDATTRLPAEADDAALGAVVQGYRLVRKLSSSEGIGVFDARHQRTDSPAVVKWLPRTRADYPRAVQALYSEAQLAQRLVHPNLLELEHADEDPTGCVLAYTAHEGASLHEVLDRLSSRGQALPVDLAALVVADLARGLAFVTDLKARDGSSLGLTVGHLGPGVVLVDRQGQVRLATGSLRLVPDRSFLPSAWLEDEGVPFVAPECLTGGAWTARAAVYGAGVMLFELLAGRRTYPGARPEAVPALALADGPAVDALAHEEVPRALIDLVRRAVAKAPEDRVASPADLAAELEAWMQARPPPSPTNSLLGRFLEANRLFEETAVSIQDPVARAPLAPSETLSAIVLAEAPDSVTANLDSMMGDEEATVQGDAALLELVLNGPVPNGGAAEGPTDHFDALAALESLAPSGPWRTPDPWAGSTARGSSSHSNPHHEPSEETRTRRGHVIPAALLSPLGPELMVSLTPEPTARLFIPGPTPPPIRDPIPATPASERGTNIAPARPPAVAGANLSPARLWSRPRLRQRLRPPRIVVGAGSKPGRWGAVRPTVPPTPRPPKASPMHLPAPVARRLTWAFCIGTALVIALTTFLTLSRADAKPPQAGLVELAR